MRNIICELWLPYDSKFCWIGLLAGLANMVMSLCLYYSELYHPYLHVHLLFVSLYMVAVWYYHISLFGARAQLRAGSHLHTSKYLDLSLHRLPSHCFRTVLNSVPTVSASITSPCLVVIVTSKWYQSYR